MKDPERHKRICALVNDALDHPILERAAFLDEACADEPDLRREVDQLLDQVTPVDVPAPLGQQLDLSGVFARLESAAEPDLPLPQPVPEQIAGYRVVRLLGEGGMGAVYLAEQTEPVARQVALKLIHTSLHTPEILRQFHAERNALARLSHPNVAVLHEAGATEDGFPFFAMEHVPDGRSLTRYCDHHALGVEERLELFVQVCKGVHHAHQKGILHRDLKPSNVLATQAEGVHAVKVIDFGLAKSINEIPLSERTRLTGRSAMGTPAYMSPEALLGDHDLDTRTDVYSLGIVLYELMVGERPLELAASDLSRGLPHTETPMTRPSQRVQQASEETLAARQTSSEGLQQQLSGDLDWIVLKALAWDREERYNSASELALDVERHLRFEPVSVGPPSLAYHARKFVRRHRSGVAMSLAALALALVSAGLLWQTQRAADRRTQLTAELNREVERIEWFERVQDQLPLSARGDESPVIRATMARIEERQTASSRGLALYALGRGELALGNPRAARRHLEASVEAGYDSPEVNLALGWALSDLYDRRFDALRRIADRDLRAAEREAADRELRQPALERLRRSEGVEWIAPELLEARIALQSGDLEGAAEKGRAAIERLPWLHEARFLVGRALVRTVDRDRREFPSVERDQQLFREAEAEVKLGLTIGRSDPEGHLLLCGILGNHLNLAVRYSLPDFDEVRRRTEVSCQRAFQADPSNPTPRLIEATSWHGLAEVQLWDRGEDPRDSVRQVERLLEETVTRDRDTSTEELPTETALAISEARLVLGRAAYTEAVYLYRNSEDPRPAYQRAVDHLERAIELDPLSADNRARLTEVLAERADWLDLRGHPAGDDRDRAIEAGRMAIRLQPEMFSASYALGRALYSRAWARMSRGGSADEDLAQAAAIFSQAAELDPESLVIPGALAATKRLQAALLRKRGEDSQAPLEESIAILDQAIARLPDATYPRFQRGRAFVDLAWNQLERGDDPTAQAAAAKESFREGLEALPDIAGVWVDLAELAVLEGLWALSQGQPTLRWVAQVEDHVRRALELDSERSDAVCRLAEAYLFSASAASGAEAQRAFDAARDTIERAIEMAPDKAESRIVFARLAWMVTATSPQARDAFEATDLWRRGLEQAAEAERLDSTNAEATLLRGALLRLDPATHDQGEQLVASALMRNTRLVLDWRERPSRSSG